MPHAPNALHAPQAPHAHDAVDVPRGALLAIGALLACTLAAVALVRLTHPAPDSRSAAPVVAQRVLQFDDLPDGAVAVRDAQGAPGERLSTVAAGEDGFLRGALRALVRERRAAGLGAEQPFVLMAHADGRLTLQDPATGRHLALEAFGPEQAARFARLLPSSR